MAIAPFIIGAYVRLMIAAWMAGPAPQNYNNSFKAKFIALSITGVILNGLCGIIISLTLLNLSNRLHNSMLQRVSHAPMSFFTSHPLGRIINRFSKDTAVADSNLVNTGTIFLQVIQYPYS